MDKKYKKYDSRGSIHVGDPYWERNWTSSEKKEDTDKKREKIIQKIEEKEIVPLIWQEHKFYTDKIDPP